MAKHAVVEYEHVARRQHDDDPKVSTFGHAIIRTRNPYRTRAGYGAPDVFDVTASRAGRVHGPYATVTMTLIGHWETSRTSKRFVVSPYYCRNVVPTRNP